MNEPSLHELTVILRKAELDVREAWAAIHAKLATLVLIVEEGPICGGNPSISGGSR